MKYNAQLQVTDQCISQRAVNSLLLSLERGELVSSGGSLLTKDIIIA